MVYYSIILALLALAAVAADNSISVHLEPVDPPPSSNNSPSRRTDRVGDLDLGSRSNNNPVYSRRAIPHALSPRDEARFELHPVECHDPDYPEFKGHADVHHDAIKKGAERFCESDLARETLTIVDDVRDHPLHAWRWRYRDHMRVYQDYKVHWRVNCRTVQGFQDIEYPLGPYGPSCIEIMRDNFRKCVNGGIGGSTQAGCLVYTLSAGRKDIHY